MNYMKYLNNKNFIITTRDDMDFFKVIETRRSVRSYTGQMVEKDDILRILSAANMAPSALNLQQWEFIVVKGEKILLMGKSFLTVIQKYAKTMSSSSAHGLLSSEEFIRFASNYGNAPVLIVVLTQRSEDPAMQKASLESASAAMENLVLAATALGLGTCWMTGPMRDEETIRGILSIPDDREIVAVTPLGYPLVIPPAPDRRDPELREKIRWVVS